MGGLLFCFLGCLRGGEGGGGYTKELLVVGAGRTARRINLSRDRSVAFFFVSTDFQLFVV